MPYMVTCTINIPQMLPYMAAPWILWVIISYESYGQQPSGRRPERPAGPAAATAPSASPAPPTVYGKALGSQVGFRSCFDRNGKDERCRFHPKMAKKCQQKTDIAIY